MNVSTRSNSSVVPKPILWNAFAWMEKLFLLLSLYLLAVFVSLTLRSAFKQSRRTGSSDSAQKKTRTYLFAIVTVFMATAVTKFALAQWMHHATHANNWPEHCAKLEKAIQTAHALGSLALYTFLWLRQNTLYRSPLLQRLATPALIKFSYGVLGFIVLFGSAVTIGLGIFSSAEYYFHIPGTNTCSQVNYTSLNGIVVGVGYAAMVATQVCLLYLFIRILQRHQHELAYFQSGQNLPSTIRLHRLVRNSTIAALVAVASDISIIILDTVFQGKISQLVSFGLFDADVAVNMICTVFCFSVWKKIFQPWVWYNTWKSRRKSTITAITQNA